jgi:polysaccharide deacetylase 2 family uncharacterized protein YibQ
VLLVAGVGLVKWSSTRTGQAALLSLGSQKMYGEVQEAVEQALLPILPDLDPGPAVAGGRDADPLAYDWPAPQLAQGAEVRCRLLAVPADIPYRHLELTVQQALEPIGARILWGQRLSADTADGTFPDELTDCLRLDVGVPDRPTHTLVLYRDGSTPPVRWGHGRGLSAWSRLAAHGDRPVVAVVIDDWGYGKTEATRLLRDLPVPLTMAVLPGLPYSREFALSKTDLVLPPGELELAAGVRQSAAEGRLERLAAGCLVEVSAARERDRPGSRRREILLHLPMEPQGYPETDPGSQAVMVGMSRAEIETRLERALAALDRVTGVNNHMGSAATSDRATMQNLCEALQGRGLLFLDSLTTARSVAYEVARESGLPALRNRIFLDYDNEDEEKIAAHLEKLVDAARSSGFAVGIGHPHRATARVLAREIPRLAAEGVVFVTVSEMYALMAQRGSILP